MGKRNRSKRLVQQGKNSINQHAERFPYHLTYAEAEKNKQTSGEL